MRKVYYSMIFNLETLKIHYVFKFKLGVQLLQCLHNISVEILEIESMCS